MGRLALLSLPMVRLVDLLVGSKNGIRIDVTTKFNETYTGLLTHRDLEKSVGDSIAAFAVEMMTNNEIKPGIYFPEEVQSKSFRENIINFVKRDAITYSIEKCIKVL